MKLNSKILLLCLFGSLSQMSYAANPTDISTPSDGRYSMSFGFEYSTGDYGDIIDTDVWVIPLSIKYRIGLWSFGVSSSWLHVISPNGVDADGNFIGGGGAQTTQKGIGDTSLSANYNWFDDRSSIVGLDVIGKIKLPTADEKKFLGSGKTDYSLNFETYKTFEKFTPYFNVGYRWKGDPDNIDYNNVWMSSLGFDYNINQYLTLGATYDYQQRVTQFSENVRETAFYANYYLNASNKLNINIFNGYTDASPNWGTSLILVHYF